MRALILAAAVQVGSAAIIEQLKTRLAAIQASIGMSDMRETWDATKDDSCLKAQSTGTWQPFRSV